MSIRPVQRRLLSCLLLLSLLLQLVLPAVAGARHGGEPGWVEICAASGIKWIKLDPAQAAGTHAGGDHCMLCAATGAAPEFDARRYLRAELAAEPPRLAVAGPTFIFPGHSLRSRAPPVLS